MANTRRGVNGDQRAFLRRVEDEAAALRARAGVGPDEPLDPRRLAGPLGIVLVSIDEIAGLAPEDREHLRSVDARVWSGAGMPLPNGKTLVILHPDQTPERATATVMEEVCHRHYGHKPSQLVTMPGGLVKRQYDAATEQEAYWTAAAALLPSKVVAMAVWRQNTSGLAARYGVSQELVDFRIKVLRLWPHRRKAA